MGPKRRCAFDYYGSDESLALPCARTDGRRTDGLWAIPTAIAALVIHMTRLLRLDASIRRDVMAWRAEQGTQGAAQ